MDLRQELIKELGATTIDELPIGTRLVVDQIVATHARILRCQQLAQSADKAIEVQGYDNQVRTSEAQLMRMLKSVGLLESKNKSKKKSPNDYFPNTKTNDERTKEQTKKRIA